MRSAHIFLVCIFILGVVACSSENNTVNMKEKKAPNVLQKSVDSMIQPQINSINKAKALEGKLKQIEEDRLKTVEGFGQ